MIPVSRSSNTTSTSSNSIRAFLHLSVAAFVEATVGPALEKLSLGCDVLAPVT